MKLFEKIPLPFNYRIKESEGKPGVLLTVEGTFQKADIVNANGRIYPKAIWDKILSNEEVKERLESKQMVGMFGHPASGQTDPMHISHVVTTQEMKSDGTIVGSADILDTPAGRVVETLFRSGVKLGVSSRGDGSVERKGGNDEVQADFRLETYDFVLKPSTPGAYPGISEEVDQNESMIVDAIEGLVNKKQGVHKDYILLECLKTLSSLSSGKVVDRVKTVSAKITEELTPRILKQSTVKQVESAGSRRKERVMTINAQGAKVPSDTLQWHRSEVTAAVRKAIAAKNEELKQAKDALVRTLREHTDTKKRLQAAESIIEDFQKQMKGLDESKGNVRAYRKLQERYDAAVELLDAAIERLPEIGSLGRRSKTLESLLQSSINKIREDRIDAVVEECLSRMSPETRKTARPVLESCETPEKVAETYKAILQLSGKQESREPLPRPRQGQLQEAAKRPDRKVSNKFVGALSDRLARAV